MFLVEKRGSRKYPINLVIDSPGGHVEPGLLFIDVVNSLPAIQTITIQAQSMAAFIVEMINGPRLMSKDANNTFVYICQEFLTVPQNQWLGRGMKLESARWSKRKAGLTKIAKPMYCASSKSRLMVASPSSVSGK